MKIIHCEYDDKANVHRIGYNELFLEDGEKGRRSRMKISVAWKG
jgi:hypothetical protein